MKTYRILFMLTAALFTVSSCENKHDLNGDFDGLWQLTGWDHADGTPVSSHTGIYYGVQLKLMSFHSNKINPRLTYLAYFTRTPDSLKIFHVVDRSADTLCPLSTLQPYGVPASGGFGIQVLNSSRMVLTNKSETLYFRKY